MKRYRVLNYQFDTRANVLRIQIEDGWDPSVKSMWEDMKKHVANELLSTYGPVDGEQKIEDFTAMGHEPFSVVAFHNKFLRQTRNAFTAGSYYPALTGACALGERILNHLLLGLRDLFKATEQYKKVYNKGSFDDWELVISTLEKWGVFRTEVADKYRELNRMRNQGIHFRPETDTNDRQLALSAISVLSEIIQLQFGAFGPLPWFIPGANGGAGFIRKDWEENPFIHMIYIPNSVLVGPYHTLEARDGTQWHLNDPHAYEDRAVSDDEFIQMFNGTKA